MHWKQRVNSPALLFDCKIRIHSFLLTFVLQPSDDIIFRDDYLSSEQRFTEILDDEATHFRDESSLIYNLELEVNARSFSVEIHRAHFSLCACEIKSQYTCVSQKRGIIIM